MSLDRVPLAPVAVAFAAGIAATPALRPALAWSLWGAALAACALLLALRRLTWATGFVLLGVAAIGALRAAAPAPAPDHVARLALPRITRVEGRIAAPPLAFDDTRTRLVLDVARADGAPRSGLLQLTIYGAAPPLAVGQRIAATSRLHRATGFVNPDGFDHAAYLARQGILVVGAASAERVEPLEAPHPGWAARTRARALAAIGAALPPASAALLGGLLLGERRGLPPELDEGFRRAGVYHVLAVSGFNVALLAAAVFAACKLARIDRRVSAVVAIALVSGFAAVVGAEPSVVRAAIMAVLVLAALLLEREASVVNSLALAGLVILALRPGDLLDPGFQLSFAATAGIVAAPLGRSGVVLGALGVSLAAQLAVLPITLAHFNQLSTIGVLANLGVVPLSGLATVGGLVGVTLEPLSATLARVAFDAVWPVLLALRAVVALAAAVPGAVVHLPSPHWVAIVGYAAALALARLAWHTRTARPLGARRRALAALGLLVAAVAIEAWPLVRPTGGRLRLTVLDVGQGDAIVLEGPDGRTAVVDGGSGGPTRLDAGERIIAPYLWNRGVRRLAAAVVTHADADHAGGMPAIERAFGVPGPLNADALARGPLAFGGATLSLLRPIAASEGASRNDAALVLRIDYGVASFLLASDIEAERERALVAAGAPLGATVLKVPHHGSRSSTTASFLGAVTPVVAVVSVGARNPYGHPDAGVLARLTAAGARVYRTDRDGAVILETDGRALTVTRWAAGATERFCLDPDVIC